MPSATPAHLNDEDFINKSLLASLDAQADAEPVPTDDDIHDDDPNITRYALSRHPAPDDQQDQYAAFHHLHGAEGLYSVHQGLYSSQAQHMHQEYSAEYMHHPHHPPGAQQTHAPAAKLNGFAGAPNYRNSFTSYPNTTRTRHQVNQSVLAASSSYREQGATFYPSQDTFPGQITSPVMQQYGSYDYQQQSHQQQLHPHQQQPHQQQQSQPVANGLHKSPYLIDPYAASSKSSAQQQQQQQPAPGQGQSYAFSSGIGVQLSSQTPYGPHVPAGVAIGVPPSSNANNVNSNAGIPPGLSTSVSIGMANGNGPTTTANGEEISTIFVVGFPEDMQEREFQNMFTFSPGFEAATLKIPHKEYNAYNPLLSGSGAANGIGGAAGAQGVARGYGVANDPYNLVQVNQGGVVDAGRDGWPAQPQGEDLVSHYAMGGMGINPLNTLNPLSSLASLNSLNPLSAQAQAQTANTLSLALPPRKQIIGFAKFRSREEALVARDVLQGRRVDIEKGAVLKAEMAKKNLHTKRGVGLVGGVGQVGTVGQQVAGPHSNGGAIDNLAFGVPEPGLARIGHWQRENGPSMSAGQPGAAATSLSNSQSIDGLTVDGLNGKDSNGNASSGVPTDDEGRKRDSVGLVGAMGLSSLGSLSIGGGIRGAREREEEERERERRRRGEREMNLMRLRASNSAAFDAFHGVSTTSTVNGAPTNGASVTSHVAVGGNASASAAVMSRQSSGTSSSSLWGSPAITAAAVAATTIDSPSQLGQGQENTALAPTEQQLDLLESSHDHEDDYEDHLEQMHQQLDEEEEELERQQMEQERKEEEELMHREYHEQLQQQEHAQAQAQQGPDDVAAGPWDRIHGVVSYAAVARPSYLGGGGNAGSTMGATANAQAHPSSSSERSTSPGSFLDAHHGPGQAQPQGGYIPQFQHLQYHHDQQKQLQLQRQSQQFGQQPTLHNAHHGQHNQGYRTQSESSETSAIDVAASNPAGYVGAAPMRPLGVHTNGILERLQQHASSSSSSTSASVSTSTSASTSALASGSTSAFASSVSSSTSTSAGNTGGSANGNGGGVSPLPAGSSTGSGSANTSAPGSAGNTSPQLPSPAGSGGSASTTSLRGTVDQNPPINTLYVGNLPTSPPPLGYPNDYLEETLREVFSARPGYRKLCFRHKANGPMCFVEFEDVQFATKALAEMSGNTLRGAVKNGIRLSYSKNPLGVRTSNNSGGQTTSGSSTPSQAQQFAQVPNNAGQYQQGPQSAGSESFLSRSADDFSGHQQQQQQHRLPTSILRRDSTLSPTSPTYSSGNANSYFASPPPRFYSAGSPTGTTQLTGASTAFVPRASAAAAAAANGFGGYGASAGGGFSPFGMPFGSGEQLGSFGQPMLHQHQSYNQHSIPEGQFPQQQQQQQQQPDE